MVPTNNTAVGLGLRTTAAHGIQAVALGFFFGAECVNEFAILEVTATLTVVMNGLVEDDLRLVVGGELRELANKDCVYEDSLEPFRVSRATGDVDNRGIDTLLLQVLLNTQRTSGVGVCTHPATVYRTRTKSNNRICVLCSMDQVVGTGLIGNTQRLAVPTFQNCTFVNEDVVSGLDRLCLCFFHGPTCSSGKGLTIVKGNHFQHYGCGIRGIYLCERLRTTSARSALDPDCGIQAARFCADNGILDRASDARCCQLRQACSYGKRATELHEATTRNTTCLELAQKLRTNSLCYHVHTSLRVSLSYKTSEAYSR